MKPLVSILIPAYNAAPWLAQTLRSALAQTWPHREIIVVDDGSSDHTLAVAQSFASQDVRVQSQPNAGASAARNRAFSLSCGDFIQWLDADDLLAPDKIARQVEAALAHPGRRTLFSSGWAYFTYRPHKARFVPTPLWESLAPCEWMLRKWEHNLHMQTATWLVPRELAAAAGPWDTRLLGDDDGEYFSRVIQQSNGIRFVPRTGSFYRLSGSSRLSYVGASESKMNAQFLGMKLQIGYLLSLASDARARAACVKYLQDWQPHFYPHRMDIVNEARQLAASLGGALPPPRLSWKYVWIQKLLGWRTARQAQLRYNVAKAALLRQGDRLLSGLEPRRELPLPPAPKHE